MLASCRCRWLYDCGTLVGDWLDSWLPRGFDPVRRRRSVWGELIQAHYSIPREPPGALHWTRLHLPSAMRSDSSPAHLKEPLLSVSTMIWLRIFTAAPIGMASFQPLFTGYTTICGRGVAGNQCTMEPIKCRNVRAVKLGLDVVYNTSRGDKSNARHSGPKTTIDPPACLRHLPLDRCSETGSMVPRFLRPQNRLGLCPDVV